MLETHVPTSTLGEYVSFHVLFNLTSSYRLKCVFHFYQTVVKMMYIKSSCRMNIYITKIFENLSKFTFSYLFESKITFVTVITLVGSLKWTVNFSVNEIIANV